MAGPSPIEWTERTWNPVVGCAVHSPGCTNCYAMAAAARLERCGVEHYAGLTRPTKAGPVWTGEFRAAPDHILTEPLRRRKPTTYFVNSMSDLFGEGVPDALIDRVFAIMALSPRHTYQVLTKRSPRMRAYLADPKTQARVALQMMELAPVGEKLGNPPVLHPGRSMTISIWPLPNVWLGVSAEDQRRADERIPDLLATPAAVRFVSLEPLLGPIELTRISTIQFRGAELLNALTGELEGLFGDPCLTRLPHLDQVIVGGESGRDPRPMHPDWVRDLRDQCVDAEAAFFFKQWGAWTPGENVDRMTGWVPVARWFDDRWDFGEEDLAWTDGHVDDQPDLYRLGKKAAGRRLDGRTWDEQPEVRS